MCDFQQVSTYGLKETVFSTITDCTNYTIYIESISTSTFYCNVVT